MGYVIFSHSLNYWARYLLIILLLGVAFDRLESFMLKDIT